MRTRERYKHLLNFIANLVTVLIEGGTFAIMWYACYSENIISPFFRRGNWAVVLLYILIIFFFTHMFGGYKVGYMRTMDIVLCHILSIIISGIIAYVELCVIARDYVSVIPVTIVCIAEMMLVLPWVYIVRRLYVLLYPPRRMLVIHGDYSPKDMIDKINSRKDKYNICASVSYRAGTDAVHDMMRKYEAVVLCGLPADVRNDIMKYCYDESIRVYLTPKLSDLMIRSAEDIHLFDMPLLLSRNQGMSIVQSFIKRGMDIILSLIGALAASPFMLLIALAIKLYDGGPVFYTQKRLTKDGREFLIYKFRSMSMDSEKKGARLASKKDKRVTPVGKIIRNIHFDELPQVFNILKGDMSIVGPRPERKVIADQYMEEIPEFAMRLKVKAGLTGYAQVYGKYNTTPYDKLKLDLTYIQNYSFWLDIKILFLTFKILFQKENTEGVDEEQVTASRRQGTKKS